MANILFLAHRIPYPPNKGDKIRSWHFLSHLLDKHNVHLGFFVDDSKDLEHVPFLEKRAASICFEKTTPLAQKVRSLRGLVTGKALTVSAYPYGHIQRYTSELISSENLDLVVLFSAATGPLVSDSCEVPIITDLVDVDSEKWAAYAKNAKWPLSWIYRREGAKLGEYEAELSSRSRETLLVSEQEAELFSVLNPEQASKSHAVPNGVDLQKFSPNLYADPSRNDTIIFTGAMDYQPNIEAVTWFCREIWPMIFAKNNGAIFKIAGGPMTSKLEALKGVPGVEVLGYVDDMAKEIAAAAVCVAPLRTARGIQNKVLEAMAMGKPTVATRLANEGINAVDGDSICVADTASDIAAKVNELIANSVEQKRVGKSARAFVENHFTWDHAFAKLDALVGKYL